MSRLKLINATNLERLLLQLGFQLIRQKGSHNFYKHKDGRTATIPFHIGKDLTRPLIRKILKDINISIEDYNNLI